MKRKRRFSTFRRLHRFVGAGAALFVLFMVFSGLVINHSNDLGLDRKLVRNPFLLDWYGLDAPEYIRSYKVRANWLSFAGSQLYLNDGYVSTLINAVGAVAGEDIIIAAGSDELLLLSNEGHLVERVPWDQQSNGAINSIGLLENGQVVLRCGNSIWQADQELLKWLQTEEPLSTPAWSVPTALPDKIHAVIKQKYRGEGLSAERILLDLHSGRFFGFIGVVIYDLLALAIGFLAISGLVLWSRSRKNARQVNGT